MQDHLWAPWRMEFIKGKAPTGCIFCELPRQNEALTPDKETLIVHRASKSYIILNKFPYNSGHLLIVPNQHTALYTDLPDDVLSEMNGLSKLAMKALDARYKPQGYNVGMNLGEAAGAGVKEHLHIHIVPRWMGDTNFMPVLAETKCLPQHLMTSFEEIAAAIGKELK